MPGIMLCAEDMRVDKTAVANAIMEFTVNLDH